MRGVFWRLGLLCALGQPALAQGVVSGDGGVLRVLDRLTGAVDDLTLAKGATAQVGDLTVLLRDCRYPADNVIGDGYAHVNIYFRDAVTPVFSGWMLAASPALNALDHPRYDVWVLRCTSAAPDGTDPAKTAD